MGNLKDKAIKWLGGFTNEEVEELKQENLNWEPYIVHKQLNTVKLCSEIKIPAWEYVPEEHLRRFLAEYLEKEIEKYMRITYGSDQMKNIYRAELEVVVREGDE